ncbi:response regulator [Amantichitinum ursilacus]|uniref:Alkaline phosphatase synthesis transcriptional regulatory protein PhoP n=1 Tax=Amantichitinum ursilacus TaxID=857265 RepID=A0A0N0XFM9_9NEIS|nr:response regulator [Amantichitinum ursilacus]KPC49212.1 Alkaline phosphatase synthesis transcriptional regulatory protein PhoP [Amantichitinum ursilacus]
MPQLQRILYVEDEPDIQLVARMALEMIGGFQIVLCSSGQAALDAAPTAQADLFLLDVMMPGMDGPTTLGRLREQPALAGIPAIFMTAKAQPAEVANLLALGASGVIPKPFDPMTLADEVRTLWQHAITKGD